MSGLTTPLELAALATAAVPGLHVAGLRPPQFSDDVVSVTGMIDTDGNHWTVVVPHDEVGGLDMEIQSAVLSRLAQAHAAGALRFEVPHPAGFIRTRQGTRAMVYPQTGGDFATLEDFSAHTVFASSLAGALASLHNLEPSTFTSLDLASYSAAECRERHLAIMEEARRHTVIPGNLWDRWKNALESRLLWRFTTTPVHGDLQLTSIQLKQGCVQLISGFSSAHVGDPAEDVAWIRSLAPDQFLERFYQSYAYERTVTDLHLMTRAQLISELAVVRWLVHGIHAGDSEIVHQAESMLAQISEELADQQLVEVPSVWDTAPAQDEGSTVERARGSSASATRYPLSRSQGSAAAGTEDAPVGAGREGAEDLHQRGDLRDVNNLDNRDDLDDLEQDTGLLQAADMPTESLPVQQVAAGAR